MKKNNATPTKDAQRDPNARKIISVNRRAHHEYEIEETYQAGMALVGTEVKSLRAGHVNFKDSFVRIENNEAWLYNMEITPYEQGNRWNVEPTRKRKLLLHGWEINEMRGRAEQKGLTIVPLQLYFIRGFVKVEIGLGRGKKLYDKRESIADRDRQREQEREFSRRE